MRKKLNHWYSICLPLFPILIMYGFKIIPFLTFCDYMLLFFLIMEIITSGYKLIYNKTFVPLIVYLIIQPIVFLVFSTEKLDLIDVVGTAWRLALYIFGICLLKKNIEKDIFIKSFRGISTVSFFYGLFQFILGTYANISLSPYIPFLPILRTGLKEQQDEWINYGMTVRPRAWFSEPSMFAIYLLLALLIELFVVKKELRKKWLCVIYIAGIIISGSSTGAAGLIIMLLAWILVCPEDFVYRIPKYCIIAIVLLLPLVVILLYKSGYVNAIILHTFANGQGLEKQTHFNDIRMAMSEKTTIRQLFFGKSMQEVAAGYLPGWFATYYCLGIIGILLYVSSFYRTFKNCCNCRLRIIILTFVMLNFGTEIMIGIFILLYMSVAMLPADSHVG